MTSVPGAESASREQNEAALREERDALARENASLRARLHTLEGKVEALEFARSDLDGLLNSTHNATLLLDRDLVVRRLSEVATEVLSPDLARPGVRLAEITKAFGAGQMNALTALAERALRLGAADVSEVANASGHWFLQRVSPFRSRDDEIRGVVVSFVDIDATRKAQLALERSTERLNRAQRIARMGDFEMDVETHVITWSPSLHEMLGVPLDQALDLDTVMRGVHFEEDRARVDRWVLDALERGVGQLPRLQYRLRHRDGHPVEILVEALIEASEDGRRTLVGTVLDVTRSSELQRLNDRIMESSLTGIFVWDLETQRYTYANRRHAANVGAIVSDLTTRPPGAGIDAVLEVDRPALFDFLERLSALEDDESLEFEYRTRARDGQIRRILVLGSVFERAEDGSATRLLCSTIDVTAQRETERFNERVLESSVHGIFVWGFEQQGFSFLSDSLLTMTDYTREEAQAWGRADSFKVVHPEDVGIAAAFVEAVAAAPDGETLSSNHRLVTKHGRVLEVATRASIFERDASGKPLSMLGFNLDVTAERAAERLNTRILESASTGIFVIDVKRVRYVYANPQISRMSGFTQDELLGFDESQLFSTLHPDDHELVGTFLSGLQSGRQTQDVIEYRAIRKGGVLTWLQTSASVFERDADGTPRTILGFMVDITEQKWFEAFRDRIDATAVTGIFTIDLRDVRYTYANEKAIQMLGYPEDELFAMSGDETFRLVHPDDREMVRELLTEIAAAPGSETVGASYRLVTCGGETIWVVVRMSVFERDSSGAPISILGFSLDVSEERRAQGINERIMASTVTGIAVADTRSQTCTYMNSRMGDILGYSVDELKAMDAEALMQLTHPDDRGVFQGFANEVMGAADGEVAVAEVRCIRPNGEVRWITMHGTVFERDASGVPISVIGFNLDDTDRKLAQLELERRSEGLEQFAKIAAHDLQEPLRTIKSFVGVLEESLEDDLDELPRQSMGFITNAAERMSSLITDLLDYSRVGLGELERNVDMNDVLEEVKLVLAARISETNAFIEVGPLPSVDGRRDDYVMLFLNLVTNALKYRQPDVPPWIRVQCRREGVNLHWTVRDNGIGIEAAHQERIFGVFQRLHLRSEIEGTGIGLAHCRKIVENFGGRIWCESEPGVGSTFHFVLPVVVPSVAALNG